MEIRGLGIVFIPDLFGPEGVREEMPIDLVCQLEKWTEGAEYERVGLERATQRIGGVAIPARDAAGAPGRQHGHRDRGGRARPAPARRRA